MASALDGLRVVELGSQVSAPFCARLFADLGADVLKVEPPTGDSSRRVGPFPGDTADPEESGLFHFVNAGKRGATCDLDTDAGLDWFHRLLAGSDVLVENLEPGDRDRFGLDFTALETRHPHLIAVSLSPYGRSGEWADRPGTDLTAQAASSLVLGLGSEDQRPLRIPWEQADYQAAFHGAAAALCAVRERRSSGRGQGIDVAAAQVMGYLVGGMHNVTAKNDNKWARHGTLLGGAPYPSGFFTCADGFVCIASTTPKQWEAFLDLMDNPKWAKDEARNSIYLGLVDSEPAHHHFQEWLMCYSRAELLEMAAAESIVMGVAQTVEEVLASEQFAFRELWASITVGDSDVRIPKPGYKLSESPTAIDGRGPALAADPMTGDVPEPVALTAGERPVGALEGIRVLDFGWNWAGPMAGQLLADMGAEVIRVETSKRQDLMRFLDYTSHFFCHNNRSKMSTTINVAVPEGARLARELAKTADIVMDNFAAGKMAKNGLGYDELREANPELIVVSMSMAGQEGPLSGMRGFASIATGYSGLELMVGYPEAGVSTGLLPFGLGDTSMSVQAAIGALAALEHRERTGEGQFVDVSQIDCAAATMGQPLLEFQLTGRVAGAQGNSHAWYCPHGLYATAGEDRWLALAVRDDHEWERLVEVIGRSEWATDEALATPEGRRERSAEIDEAISGWAATLERDEAVDRLLMAGVPAAPALELEERNEHAHWKGRGFTLWHDFEGFDPCTIYATPWLLTGTPPELTRPTPRLGEHNDYVCGELLGLDPDEIVRLQGEGVLV
ncbi:MAG: CoA transferase [Acidimicrobiia bacterium]|nr:CoA transferase [Acidimicrobiia bacterium]